jgi:outer membrane protein, multidrug efflux system
MKNHKNTIIHLLVILCIMITGCKTASNSATPASLKPLPTSFADVRDSSSIASINWKTFFRDSLLVGLIDTALKNNLDLLLASQRIEMARAQVRASKGMLLPTINAYLSAGQSKYGLYTMDGAGNITTDITPGQIVPIHLPDYYMGLQTSWELDVWGKLRNKKRAAIARYLGSVEGRNWAVTQLVSELASSYYELLALDSELEIIRETIKLQENALEIITVQKRAASVNELAVEQFEAQLLASKSMEIELLQKIIENESRINLLIGGFPKTIVRSKVLFDREVPDQMKVGIPSDLLKNRPDIQQAAYELVASKADLRAAKAAFYPSFNINGTLGFQAFNPSFLLTSPESMAYRLFGSLTAPLINRSAIQASFNTAKANQVESMYNYQKSVINAYVEVYNEMANLKNLKQIRDLKDREVKVLTKSTNTSTQLFRTGNATYLEVLLAQRNALVSKTQLVDVKKRQFEAQINIYKALGGGWR